MHLVVAVIQRGYRPSLYKNKQKTLTTKTLLRFGSFVQDMQKAFIGTQKVVVALIAPFSHSTKQCIYHPRSNTSLKTMTGELQPNIFGALKYL